MILLLFFLQNSEGSEKTLLGLAAIVGPIISAIITWFLMRPKTQSEIDKTESDTKKNYEEIISNLHKDITVIRKESDEKVSAAQNKVIEVYEKLGEWIKRVENYAAESIQSDEDLADAQRALEKCLETKDTICQKCIQKALVIFSKIERTLAGNPDYNDLLVEMWEIRKELLGE